MIAYLPPRRCFSAVLFRQPPEFYGSIVNYMNTRTLSTITKAVTAGRIGLDFGVQPARTTPSARSYERAAIATSDHLDRVLSSTRTLIPARSGENGRTRQIAISPPSPPTITVLFGSDSLFFEAISTLFREDTCRERVTSKVRIDAVITFAKAQKNILEFELIAFPLTL
mmetsp:Transcript_22836/g.91414  ORF Transcript_22836/g.91414 Transcript_22836/m.91414 type:complete len:169 (-) Transcript_22836:2052-2558(-)